MTKSILEMMVPLLRGLHSTNFFSLRIARKNGFLLQPSSLKRVTSSSAN